LYDSLPFVAACLQRQTAVEEEIMTELHSKFDQDDLNQLSEEELLEARLSVEDRARRRLSSCLLQLTSRQEKSGPEIAHSLLGRPTAYKSDGYVKLYLYQFRGALKKFEEPLTGTETPLQSGTLTSTKEGLTTAPTQLDDYRYRPSSLAGESVYSFVGNYCRVKIPPRLSEELREGRSLRNPHKLHATHLITAYPVSRTPVLVGFTLPNRKTEPEEHAKIALLMFKPWRTLDDLKDAGIPWSVAFSAWENDPNGMPVSTAQILRYFQQLREGSDIAQKERDERAILAKEQGITDPRLEYSEDAYSDDEAGDEELSGMELQLDLNTVTRMNGDQFNMNTRTYTAGAALLAGSLITRFKNPHHPYSA
jgi:hypothetical protein